MHFSLLSGVPEEKNGAMAGYFILLCPSSPAALLLAVVVVVLYTLADSDKQ